MGDVPTGVKVISVLYYIGAVFELLLAVALIFGAGAITSQVPFLALIGPFLIVGGIILAGLAVLSFFVGRGLWKAQKWSRIVAIIFAVIGALFSLLGLFTGATIVSSIVQLIINLAIGGYLWFSSGVKAAFA